MSKPKATIMIPAYNAEKFLPQALESALNQTFRGSYEVLIVDDCSTDNSVEVIKDFQKKYPRLRLINHRKNQGAGYTRNTLLENSGGDVLVGLDNDDRLHPRALEKIVDCMNSNNKISFVYANHEEINEEGNLLGVFKKDECNKHFKDLILHFHFPGHPRAWRKESIGNMRFDPSLTGVEDYDFLLKVILSDWNNLQVGFIPEVLYSYRIHNNMVSQVKTQERIEKDTMTILKKHLKNYGFYGDKEFEVAPIKYKNLHLWDHKVEGRGVMKEKAKQIAFNFLKNSTLYMK
ncbi:chondroitin synthase [archaeon BMS3Abin17]|nr:chondroitin synthase [archaeon BMS3Abin17]HDZ60508.1 glycosyltransferase family 2 protein [Candidatus Pacearchaeota archaeon]